MQLQVVFYTRKDCKICEEAKANLEAIQSDIPHQLVEVDIDTDPDLQSLYGHRVPVIQSGPYTLEPPFDERKLRMTLGAARDSQAQWLEDLGETYEKKLVRRRTMSRSDRFSFNFAKRYLLFINLFLFIYVGLPFLAPVLLKAGLEQPADAIYWLYGATCHKLAYRSWFLFGEQPFYPRAAAGLEGYETFGEATGINEENIWEARDFNGNAELGYKVSLCQRDTAIYAAMLFFGLLFWVTGERIKPLPWYWWLLLGLVPIGLDGVSQLASQFFNLSWLPYRESTPYLRTITGFLFGFTTAWFGFPVIKETMDETRVYLAAKQARVDSSQNNSQE